MTPHSNDTRARAYSLWRSGIKKSVISRELGVDYDTVLIWAKRFSEEGEAGISPRYQNCGRKAVPGDPIRARALELRQAHRDWGAEYIRLHLGREFAGEKIVGAKQIRHWFRAAGLVPQRTKLPKLASADWADRPLARVQADAKERLRTARPAVT